MTFSSPSADPAQNHVSRIDTITQVVALAEKVALDFFNRRASLSIERKSPTDFVSEADRSVEQCIRSFISERHPDDLIVGEEFGGQQGSNYWLIDPIDGTSNFLSGLPLWSISIAFVENNHPTIGVVSTPMLNRCLLGGQAIGLREIGLKNNNAKSPSVVFGIGQNEHWSADRRAQIETQLSMHGLYGVSLGSCATSLAFAASGELSGYAEGNVGFWDIAAGIALCEAADVPVSFSADQGKHGSFVAAGPEAIQPKIYDITQSLP